MTPFDEFWNAWTIPGTKRGRGHAEKAFEKALCAKHAPSLPVLVAGVMRYMAHCKLKGVEPEFIKHPATWLRAKGWYDEYPSAPVAVSAVPRRPIFTPSVDRTIFLSDGEILSTDIGQLSLREGWGGVLIQRIKSGEIKNINIDCIDGCREEKRESREAYEAITDGQFMAGTLRRVYEGMLGREANLRARHLKNEAPQGGQSEGGLISGQAGNSSRDRTLQKHELETLF